MHSLKLNPTRGSRGQAVFETALFMPLFLLGFFGVIFAVSYASLAERVQFGVRYGGTVANLQSPYQSYSLYAMYDEIDGGVSSNPTTCGGALPDTNQVLAPTRGAMWRASVTGTDSPKPNCSGGIGEIVFSADQPMLLENSLMTLTASTPLSGFMKSHVFGTTNTAKTTSAAANFFRGPDVGSLVGCSTLANTVKASLEAVKDNVTSSAPGTALPAPLPSTPVLTVPQTCSTFVPYDQLASVTAPPLVANTPTPGPPPTCPAGYSGTYPACVSPPPTCPAGYSGTYPACVAPPTSPPTVTPTSPPPTLKPTAAPPTTTPTVAPPTAKPTVAPPTTAPTTTPATPLPTVAPPTLPPSPTPLPTAGERS